MITLRHIGKSADDLRFSILLDGRCAGGITVHRVNPPAISYGIAVAPAMRRRGVAKTALPLLFARMAARGFTRAVVQVAPQNAASLSLHRHLGFSMTHADAHAVTLSLSLPSTRTAPTR